MFSTLRHVAHLLGMLWEVIYCEADCLCHCLCCCDSKSHKFIFICVKLDSEICVLAGELVLEAIPVKQGGSVHSLLTMHSFHSLGCKKPGKLLARHISSI